MAVNVSDSLNPTYSSPNVPTFVGGAFATAAARRSAGQSRRPDLVVYQQDDGSSYKLLPLALCFNTDGTAATNRGTWGTLDAHWVQVASEVPYPSQALRNALVGGDYATQYSTTGRSTAELTTALSAALAAESVRKMHFKSGSYDYWYDFCDNGTLGWYRVRMDAAVATTAGGSGVTSFNARTGAIQLLTDDLNALLAAGTGVTLSTQDGKIKITSTAPSAAGGGYTLEQVQDIVATMFTNVFSDSRLTWNYVDNGENSGYMYLTIDMSFSSITGSYADNTSLRSIIPTSVSPTNKLVASNDPRLTPLLGVQYVLNGVPKGLYLNVSQASAAALNAGALSGVVFNVFGSVAEGGSLSIAQPCTINLTTGSTLRVQDGNNAAILANLNVNASNESQNVKRVVRIVGEGTLEANIATAQVASGCRTEVQCAKWTGHFIFSVFGAGPANTPVVELAVRNCEVITNDGDATVLAAYQYAGFYRGAFAATFDNSSIFNTAGSLVRTYGSDTGGSGATPDDAASGNSVRLRTTSYQLADGVPIANVSQGGVSVDSDTVDGLVLSTGQMDAVIALTYTDGDATGTPPAFSRPGMEFDAKGSDGINRHYYCRRATYVPGSASGAGPAWHRVRKTDV